MIDDVKRRAPFYLSDWRDAWDYRVVPATVYMYFAKYGSEKCNSSITIPFCALKETHLLLRLILQLVSFPVFQNFLLTFTTVFCPLLPSH